MWGDKHLPISPDWQSWIQEAAVLVVNMTGDFLSADSAHSSMHKLQAGFQIWYFTVLRGYLILLIKPGSSFWNFKIKEPLVTYDFHFVDQQRTVGFWVAFSIYFCSFRRAIINQIWFSDWLRMVDTRSKNCPDNWWGFGTISDNLTIMVVYYLYNINKLLSCHNAFACDVWIECQ
jgi:hypothetical protein